MGITENLEQSGLSPEIRGRMSLGAIFNGVQASLFSPPAEF